MLEGIERRKGNSRALKNESETLRTLWSVYPRGFMKSSVEAKIIDSLPCPLRSAWSSHFTAWTQNDSKWNKCHHHPLLCPRQTLLINSP